jgi:pimeloyl-ACP methyl ester carboxylesterase
MPSLQLSQPKAVLRYHDIPGEARPLVFIHGLGCASTSHFSETVADPRLAGHRKILIDLLGHGYSDRPDDFGYSLEEHAETVIELLDHLALQKCALVGHSMGGAIAITVAAIRPDLVSQLILAEPNLNPGGGFVSKLIAGQSEEEFVRTGHQQLLERLTGLGFVTSVGSFRVCSSRGLYRSGVGLAKGTVPTMRDRLYATDIPRAFLAGEKGLPDPVTDELAAHGVQVLVVANAGHDMMFDNPSGVAEAIEQALRTAVPAARAG